jgi:hypothetical protein
MPSSAMHHIQNTAPGPPSVMAIATPAMFPAPTRAASDVAKAANGEMPSGWSALNPRPKIRKKVPKRRNWMPRSRMVK